MSLSEIWEDLTAFSNGYVKTQRILAKTEERIRDYEQEFETPAFEARVKLSDLRTETSDKLSKIVANLGTWNENQEDPFRDELRSANDLFKVIQKLSKVLVSIAITEIAIALQAKTETEALNPYLIEESQLAEMTKLQMEHENHIRTRGWASSPWIRKEEGIAKGFHTSYQVSKNSRRRKAAKAVFWPTLTAIFGIIGLLASLRIEVDLAILVFIIGAVAFFLLLLPSLSTGVVAGWRMHRFRTVLAVVLSQLLPLTLAFLLTLNDFLQGAPLLSLGFIARWSVFEVVGLIGLDGIVGPYRREFLKHRESELHRLRGEQFVIR